MKREDIRLCLDENLSGLCVTEERHRTMMREITAGGKRARGKASAAIVLFAVLLMMAATAAAAVLLYPLFERTIDMEMERGPFSTWSLEEKAELIGFLSESGWAFPEKDVCRLRDARTVGCEKERLATQMLVDMFGREDAISHMDIIESVKGPVSTWSLEDKAWYSEYTRSKMARIDSWRDVLPEEGDLTREEAIEIAREAILEAHAIGYGELGKRMVNVSFFVNAAHEEPCWLISWQSDPYASSEYTVLLTRTGEIAEDAALEVYTPAHMACMMAQAGEDEADSERPQGHMEQWSLEDKARWLGDDNGIPAEGEIDGETAEEIARRTLEDRGIDTRGYAASVWYKLYDPYADDNALEGAYYAVSLTDDLDAPRSVYSVLIDPRTGEILRVYAPEDAPGNG